MEISTYHASSARGKPTFVAAMSTVWRRRSLVLLEVGWRWVTMLPWLLLLLWHAARHQGAVAAAAAALRSMSILQPAAAVSALSQAAALLWATLPRGAGWLLPLAWLVWSGGAGLGRNLVWRRLDSRLQSRPGIVAWYAGLHSVGFLFVLLLWLRCAQAAARVAISTPQTSGAEPNLVLFCGLLIAATLFLFLSWASVSWVPDQAALRAMRSAHGPKPGSYADLRSSYAGLIETNLIMGIVRVALLVLAMVFSACPLPFESVETTSFLMTWWAAVALLYLVASDYFKVVQAASYIAVLSTAARKERQAPAQSVAS